MVEQLIEAEKQPIKTIERNKGKQESRLKLVEDLESKLNAITMSLGGLASAHGFDAMKLISGDNNVVGGTSIQGSRPAEAGTSKLKNSRKKAAAVTNGFPDKNKTQVGIGYFKFQTQSETKEVYINGNNNTLEGVASQITAAHTGVKASVINDRSDTSIALTSSWCRATASVTTTSKISDDSIFSTAIRIFISNPTRSKKRKDQSRRF